MSRAALDIFISDGLWNNILQSVTDPISIISADHLVIWANVGDETSFVRLKGRPEGRMCYEVFMDRRNPCTDCPIEPVFKTGQPHVADKWLPSLGNGGRWSEVHSYPISDDQGRVLYVVKIGIDVTEQRKDQRRDLRYVEQLERSAREMLSVGGPRESEAEDAGLTSREEQVLRCVAQGMTNKEIAALFDHQPPYGEKPRHQHLQQTGRERPGPGRRHGRPHGAWPERPAHAPLHVIPPIWAMRCF